MHNPIRAYAQQLQAPATKQSHGSILLWKKKQKNTMFGFDTLPCSLGLISHISFETSLVHVPNSPRTSALKVQCISSWLTFARKKSLCVWCLNIHFQKFHTFKTTSLLAPDCKTRLWWPTLLKICKSVLRGDKCFWLKHLNFSTLHLT